jgi:hypothetical protein
MQCAEPKLLLGMMQEGIHKSTISVANFSLKSGHVYKGSTLGNIPLNFISGRIVKPIAPCTNCSQTLKGVKKIN